MEDNLIHDEYKELIMQLEEEIEGGFITEDEVLYVVRQSYEIDYSGKKISPVVDFFFSTPVLKEEMTAIKVVDVKKSLFDMLKEIPETDEAADVRAAIDEHISYLKDYTSKNNKRNDKDCYLITVAESAFPMMIYFEEDKVSTKLTKITAKELLEELKIICG